MPTRQQVELDGFPAVYAMCAIDALGIAAMAACYEAFRRWRRGRGDRSHLQVVRGRSASRRQTAFAVMYLVTRPGGHLLVADFDPSRRPLPLHPGGRRMRHAAATVGPLQELAAAAGYRVEARRHTAHAALRPRRPP